MNGPVGRLPYPGSRSFRRNETDLFFGRESCVDQMIDRLKAERFLAVLGASGSGKSSLVRTGLLDGLELGFLAKAGSHWRIIETRPGGAPMRNLAHALMPTESIDADIDLMRAFLSRGPRSLLAWCEDVKIEPSENLLLLVDQFEELFRYHTYEDRQEAEKFVALLLESARSTGTPIYVVLTMRSEYLGACALIDGLAQAMNRGQYLTPRMSRAECRSAIEGPASVCGFSIEPALVARLLNDLSDFAPWEEHASDQVSQSNRLLRRADQLPLLQHALNRLWMRATSGDGKILLTLADYIAIGGLRGALDLHAEEVLATLGPARLPIAENVFRALTDGLTVADAIRRPTRLSELAAITDAPESEVRAVIEPFRAQGCNFLVPDTAVPLTSNTFIDISHESLIRQWSRLSGWLQKEARSAESIRRIDAAAVRRMRGEGELLHGLDLANLVQWQRDTSPTAAWASRYVNEPKKTLGFLEDSRIQAGRNRRRKMAFSLVTAALVLFAGFRFWSILLEQRANESHALALQAERNEAQVQRDNAEVARKEAEKQRQLTTRVLEQTHDAFVSSAFAQADELQSAGDYARSGDFLAALIGISRASNGRVEHGLLKTLMPRLVEQVAVGVAFRTHSDIALGEKQAAC